MLSASSSSVSTRVLHGVGCRAAATHGAELLGRAGEIDAGVDGWVAHCNGHCIATGYERAGSACSLWMVFISKNAHNPQPHSTQDGTSSPSSQTHLLFWLCMEDTIGEIVVVFVFSKLEWKPLCLRPPSSRPPPPPQQVV